MTRARVSSTRLAIARALSSLALCSVTLCSGCGASVLQLDTLPDDIDPGASEPLLARAPAALRRALRSVEARPVYDLLDAARRNGRELDTQQIVISLLVMEARSEEDCDVQCLSLLELAYRMLALLGDTKFHEALSWFEPWVASIAPIDREAADAQRYMAFLRDVFDRAGERHDWVVARILRSDAEAPMRGEAIIGLAHRARSAGDHERTRQLFGLALPLLGDRADAADVGGWARACYAVLDFACGDEARTRLQAMPESSDEQARADETRRAARVVQREARGLEAGLARAEALGTLQPHTDARALYEELADDHPDDARPHVGLALAVFQRMAMQLFMPTPAATEANEEMHRHLVEASNRRNRDVAYYGLSTVSWNFRVLSRAMRAALERAERDHDSEAPVLDAASVRAFRTELHAFCDDFRSFDPGTAAAFRALGEFQLGAMSRASADTHDTASLVAPLLPRLRTQLIATPTNVALYRTVIMAAMLTDDASFVAHALAAAPPETEQTEPTAGARARASILIALRSGDSTHVRGESGDPETDAMVALIAAEDDAARVMAAASLEAVEGPNTARARNNAAVARHAAGDATARTLLGSSVPDGEATDVVRYNALALTPATERDEQWVFGATQLAHNARAAIRVNAIQLLQSHSTQTDSAQTDPELESLLREARDELTRDRLPDHAVWIDGYQVGIGYTRDQGITSTGTTPLPWLLVEQPAQPAR